MKDVGKLIDRTCKLPRILNKLRHTAKGDKEGRACKNGAVLGVHIQYSSHNCHKGEGDVVDKIYGWEKQRAVIFSLVKSIHCFIVDLVESGSNHVLGAVSRNGAGACQHFLGKAVQLTVLFRPFAEKRSNNFRTIAGKQQRSGNRQRKYKYHWL